MGLFGDSGYCGNLECTWVPENWNIVAGATVRTLVSFASVTVTLPPQYAIGLWIWIDSLVDAKTNPSIDALNRTTNETTWIMAAAISNPGYYLPWILCTISLFL